jgi:two-component sensor histidine kinase
LALRVRERRTSGRAHEVATAEQPGVRIVDELEDVLATAQDGHKARRRLEQLPLAFGLAGQPALGEHLLGGLDVVLSVEDNGIGLPAEGRPSSIGMRLIEEMARGLNRVLSIEGDQRMRVEVRFPLGPASGPATAPTDA